MVGTNASSSDTSANARTCTVRSKTSSPNPQYDSSQTQYQYLQEGMLTTVQYDCYDGTAYVCSTTFTELRQGDLQSVY